MSVEIITQEDLTAFKFELLKELRNMLTANPKTINKRWLKSREVMKLLQISPGTLQNYRINGTIPYSRFGKTLYYAIDDIEKVLQSST